MGDVIVERPRPGVALVRLNRPELRNALNMEARRQVSAAFRALTDDADVRAIVITGDEKAFAAGADIREMAESGPIEPPPRSAKTPGSTRESGGFGER